MRRDDRMGGMDVYTLLSAIKLRIPIGFNLKSFSMEKNREFRKTILGLKLRFTFLIIHLMFCFMPILINVELKILFIWIGISTILFLISTCLTDKIVEWLQEKEIQIEDHLIN